VFLIIRIINITIVKRGFEMKITKIYHKLAVGIFYALVIVGWALFGWWMICSMGN